MNDEIDNGWDRYCERSAGERLLRIASTLWALAGSKGSESIRHKLDADVHRVCKLALKPMSEPAFLDMLVVGLSMASDHAHDVVAEVKANARKMRGQLTLPGVDADRDASEP